MATELFPQSSPRFGMRARMVAAFLLPVVLLLPFVNRAYSVDDPMFVWVAQQIAREPLNFFGFSVDKGNIEVPMYTWNQNPPGYSYYLAIFGLIGGWKEISLHVGGLLSAGLFGLGTYRLAALLCARPLLATAAAVLTPGFLVSASSVMTDVAQVTCYVWAVDAWLRWMGRGTMRHLASASAWITAGALMKYYAITAVPLLIAYTLLKRRRPGAWLIALAVPIVVLTLFWWWAWHLYGVSLLGAAIRAARNPAARPNFVPLYREVVAIVFVGGCFAPIAGLAANVIRPGGLLAGAALTVVVVLPVIEGYSALQLVLASSARFGASMLAHLGVMLVAGGLLFWLPVRSLLKERSAEDVLLALWILGALVFATYVNHLICGRVLLPMAPALAIAAVRALPTTSTPRQAFTQLAALAFGAVLSLWVTSGDYCVAENARYSARKSLERASRENSRMYYAGMWGFQHYLRQAGVAPFSVDLSKPLNGPNGGHAPKMQHGDLLAVGSVEREQWRVPPFGMVPVDFFAYPNWAGVVTYHPADEAGFYLHLCGIVPYKFGPSSREEYGLYRWMGANYSRATE